MIGRRPRLIDDRYCYKAEIRGLFYMGDEVILGREYMTFTEITQLKSNY